MKSLSLLATFLGASFLATAASTEQTGAIAACTHTANSYPYYRDRLMYEGYGNLFTDDATFTLLGNTFAGRDKIVKALEVRGPTELTRHMSSVVHMEQISDTELKGVSYFTIYVAPLKTQKRPYTNQADAMKESREDARRVAGPKYVGEYRDTFRVDKNGVCKIAERNVEILFVMP